MPHSTPLITTIVGGLALAYILGMIAQRLKISPLVGYLAAGVLAGPFTPGFVADTSLAPELAEIGVILLMFGVGLHFSLKDLMAVKAIAIPGAIAQITVATLLGLGLSTFFGWGLFSGIVFGLCLSTASTVVLLRALEERGLIDSQRGQIAIGWLIVEDLAMVLALVLLPAIANMLESSDQTSISQLLINLGITIGKVVAFILIMMIVGRKLIPWILAKTAATGSRELFTLCVLALALGIAYAAVTLFDASFALGAFFAGMVLNESDLSHRAAQDTFAVRDTWLFLGKLRAYAQWWAGSAEDLARPEVSPGLADLSGLPPTLMFCGTRDTLAPGCRLLARRAAEAGWPLEYVEVPDLIHVFPLLPLVPEARVAWHHTLEFLR